MHRIDDKKAVSDSLVLAHAVSEWGTDVIPLSEAGAIFLMDSDGVFTGYKTKHWPVDIGDGIVASDLPVGYKDEARIFSGGIVRMYPDGEFEVLEKGKSNSVNVVRSYGGYTNQYGQGYQRGGYQRPKAQSPAKAGHSKVVGEVKPKDTEDTTKVEDEDESIIFLADGKDTFYKYMHDDWWLTTDGGKTFTSIDAVDWQEVPNGDDDTPPPNYDPETDFG
ncbi:MAG: hypothetical protein GWN86_10410, partial [Desulfobacterales bacterium]|nr:hypothetical protein [Desulfobacterales bacterium]